MGSASKFVFTLIVVISSFLFIYFLPHQKQICAELRNFIFHGIKINILKEESKWILLRALLLRLSAFVFCHTSAAMFLRITFGYSSPATTQDPTYIKLLNKIIQNTIQQSFIFLGLFTYFLFDGASQRLGPTQLLNLATWFILGRVLFSIGYILGTIMNLQQLRALGFALSVNVNVILIQNIFSPQIILSKYFLH